LIWLALRNITADRGRASKDWKEAAHGPVRSAGSSAATRTGTGWRARPRRRSPSGRRSRPRSDDPAACGPSSATRATRGHANAPRWH